MEGTCCFVCKVGKAHTNCRDMVQSLSTKYNLTHYIFSHNNVTHTLYDMIVNNSAVLQILFYNESITLTIIITWRHSVQQLIENVAHVDKRISPSKHSWPMCTQEASGFPLPSVAGPSAQEGFPFHTQLGYVHTRDPAFPFQRQLVCVH